MAVDRSEIAIFGYPSCLTPPTEGFPWDHLREIFSGCQRMAKVHNAVEILRKISTARVGRTNVTDDRRQTDGRATANSERERGSLKMGVVFHHGWSENQWGVGPYCWDILLSQ